MQRFKPGLFSGNAGSFLGVGRGEGAGEEEGALGWLVVLGHMGLACYITLHCMTHSEQGEVSQSMCKTFFP